MPGLPAYVILMCIRYADLFNYDDRVKCLLNSVLQAIKRLIKVDFISNKTKLSTFYNYDLNY
jgi:myosin-5